MKADTSNARLQYLLASTQSVFKHTDFATLSEHIEVHRYLINQDIPWEITWEDAAFSWLENVFHPIMQVIDRWEVRAAFAKKSLSSLFFDVSDHWYYLQLKNADTTAFHAALEYGATYGKGLGKLLAKLQLPNKVA